MIKVFNGTSGCISIECVTMLNEDHFVTGAADGYGIYSISIDLLD